MACLDLKTPKDLALTPASDRCRSEEDEKEAVAEHEDRVSCGCVFVS